MNAKFTSKCSETGALMAKGSRIAWNPTTRKAYGSTSNFYARLIVQIQDAQREQFESQSAAPDSCVSEFEHNLRSESAAESYGGDFQ